MKLKFSKITVSGRIATGTTTLATHLQTILNWKYCNAGQIQRDYDRKHGIHENKQGAFSRPDNHEKDIDAMTKQMLGKEECLIYEAWLAGFMAQGIPNVLKVLVVCSHEDIRIDRVANRDNITIAEAKQWIKQRENENFKKWQKLYGPYSFWDPKYFDVVVDTYSSGQMETVGKVLDKLGYKGKLYK